VLRAGGPMSTMKLQKLVYYSQAWSLVTRGRPLFAEDIQAWAHGPVVYELFELHRGKYAIGQLDAPAAPLLPDESRIVDLVMARFGKMTAGELSAATHSEAPWQLARAGVPDGMRASATISTESMQRFYSGVQPPFSL